MKHKMTHFFSELNERERLIVIIGSILLGIYLFYFLIASPLINGVTERMERVSQKQELLTLMENVEKKIKTLKKKGTLPLNALTSIISKTLDNGNFQAWPYQLKQTTTGKISLSFEAIPYTQLLTWLYALTQDFNIEIDTINIESTERAGVIQAQMVLTVAKK